MNVTLLIQERREEEIPDPTRPGVGPAGLWFCMDCLRQYPGWFDVKQSVWQEAGFKKYRDGIICVWCFEKRLGRPLLCEDLSSSTLNDLAWFFRLRKK